MSKPREFHLVNDWDDFMFVYGVTVEMLSEQPYEPIHVIEYSALEAANARIKALETEHDELKIYYDDLYAQTEGDAFFKLQHENSALDFESAQLKSRIADLEAKVERLEEANEILRGSPGDYAELCVKYTAQEAELETWKEFSNKHGWNAKNLAVELSEARDKLTVAINALETLSDWTDDWKLNGPQAEIVNEALTKIRGEK